MLAADQSGVDLRESSSRRASIWHRRDLPRIRPIADEYNDSSADRSSLGAAWQSLPKLGLVELG